MANPRLAALLTGVLLLFPISACRHLDGGDLAADRVEDVTHQPAGPEPIRCPPGTPPTPTLEGTVTEVLDRLVTIEITANPGGARPEQMRGIQVLVEDDEGPIADIAITDAKVSDGSVYLFGRVSRWHEERLVEEGHRVRTVP